jgi:hypothetical protein
MRCVVCGAALPPRSRSDRRTCSARCRVALSRRLRDVLVETPPRLCGFCGHFIHASHGRGRPGTRERFGSCATCYGCQTGRVAPDGR